MPQCCEAAVEVDDYNNEFKDDEGFIGDRASKGAFRDIVENWRKPLRKLGEDPFGDTASSDLTKKELDEALAKGEVAAAAIVHSAVEEFSQELALVIRRFMKLKATLRGTTFVFRDLNDVLAKANEEKSGDRLAGVAAESATERVAAKLVLSEITLEDLRNHPAVGIRRTTEKRGRR